MRFISAAMVVLLVLVLGVCAFIWSGLYNPGADNPHWKVTHTILDIARERAIEHYSEDIAVPANLNEPQMILKGAGHYAAMCANCHLAPGKNNSEIRPGLYPQPPNLSVASVEPREAFWVIKHGVKMSAMPAWGGSHDDATIWNMVAFLQKLPGMSPEQYREILAKAPADDDGEAEAGAHGHEGHAHHHD